MKTMFKVQYERYTDLEGRKTEWNCENQFQETFEKAKTVANSKVSSDFPFTGNYRIIAVTMDEETFTFDQCTVYTYDFYKEVERWKQVDECIHICEQAIEEIEKSKANAKTETGLKRKEKAIAEYTERLQLKINLESKG